VGAIAVAAAAHLAAVYLAADAARAGHVDMVHAFRARALASGVAAGALAIAGLAVVHNDAPRLFNGLTGGAGLVAVVVSGAFGIITLALVWYQRYEPARVAGALAVAAIIAGWAAAQQPFILPGLTLHAAAADRSVLIAILVSAGVGALVLVPSLVLLFGLKLRGRFERLVLHEPVAPTRGRRRPVGMVAALLLVVLVAGVGLTVFAGSGAGVGIGVALMLVFVAAGFVLLARDMVDSPSA